MQERINALNGKLAMRHHGKALKLKINLPSQSQAELQLSAPAANALQKELPA